MTKEEMLRLLTAAHTGPGSAVPRGHLLPETCSRSCADGMAQLWSMEIDGLERRALCPPLWGSGSPPCAEGVCPQGGETDEELRARTLAALAATPPPATPTTTPRGADRWRTSCG